MFYDEPPIAAEYLRTPNGKAWAERIKRDGSYIFTSETNKNRDDFKVGQKVQIFRVNSPADPTLIPTGNVVKDDVYQSNGVNIIGSKGGYGGWVNLSPTTDPKYIVVKPKSTTEWLTGPFRRGYYGEKQERINSGQLRQPLITENPPESGVQLSEYTGTRGGKRRNAKRQQKKRTQKKSRRQQKRQ